MEAPLSTPPAHEAVGGGEALKNAQRDGHSPLRHFGCIKGQLSLLLQPVFPSLLYICGSSQVVLVVKNLPANAEDTRDMGLISGSERSLEREMATRSSILAWRIPWTRSLVGYSPWSHK